MLFCKQSVCTLHTKLNITHKVKAIQGGMLTQYHEDRWVVVLCAHTECPSLLFLLDPEHVLKQQHLPWTSPPPSSFLYFTLLFWNQILTCFSDSLRHVAISILRNLDRYMFVENSLSSSRSWVLVKAVRIRLELLSLPGLTLSRSCSCFWGSGLFSKRSGDVPVNSSSEIKHMNFVF